MNPVLEGDATVKTQVRALLETMPDDCTWEDVLYEIEVDRSIQRGLEDGRAGRTVSSNEIRKRFGLPQG